MTEHWISIQAAAAHFDVSTKTIRRWITSGLIRAERVGPRLVRVDINSSERLRKPLQPPVDSPSANPVKVAIDPLVEVHDFIAHLLNLEAGEFRIEPGPRLSPGSAKAVSAFLDSYAHQPL